MNNIFYILVISFQRIIQNIQFLCIDASITLTLRNDVSNSLPYEKTMLVYPFSITSVLYLVWLIEIYAQGQTKGTVSNNARTIPTKCIQSNLPAARQGLKLVTVLQRLL